MGIMKNTKGQTGNIIEATSLKNHLRLVFVKPKLFNQTPQNLTYKGRQRPAKASKGQQRPAKASKGQQRPAKASKGQGAVSEEF